MATFKYFSDINGQVVELTNVGHDGAVSTSAKHFIGHTPDGMKVRATRKINFKSNPSLHACDGRCLSAKGGNCECSCGGKNHGRGYFNCEAA